MPIGSAPISINWSRGAMDIMASGDIVQITSHSTGVRVVRTAADGEAQWDQTFATRTWPQDIVAVPGGDVFLLSYDEDETLLLRLNGEGALIWEQSYGDGPNSSMSAMAWDSGTERLLVGGGTRGIDGGSKSGWERTWVLLLDDDGGVTWEFVGEPGTPSLLLDVMADPAGDRFVFASHCEGLHLAEVTRDRCR